MATLPTRRSALSQQVANSSIGFINRQGLIDYNYSSHNKLI
ncbi:hypothetical protein [Gilliamella apicola]|nr:hypothetical protein [Gilliamella apicola]